MTDKKIDIVVNTSPWIALSTCGQVELLKKLYSNVYVPYHVTKEIMSGGKQGEAEVIILAKEKEIKHVLIDEKVARLQAKVFGLV